MTEPTHQRAGVKVGGETYTLDDQRAFIRELQLCLPKQGYLLSNRLYRVASYALGGQPRRMNATDTGPAAGLRRGFADWPELVEYLAEHDLIAARMPSYVAHRPRRLGRRPAWFFEIDQARQRGAGLALRHVVPSHLLGYAVENAPDSIDRADRIEAVTAAYALAYVEYRRVRADLDLPKEPPVASPKRPAKWAGRRYLWSLLYNHPGNLWVGDASDNQVIGFMAGTVNAVLRRMREIPRSAVPYSPTVIKSEMERVTSGLGGNPLGEWKDLDEEIKEVLTGVVRQLADERDPTFEDILYFVEDVAANLDLDVPKGADWDLVVRLREKFTHPDEIATADLVDFLGVQFAGSLMKPG